MDTGGFRRFARFLSLFFPSQESDTEVGSWKDEQARVARNRIIQNHPAFCVPEFSFLLSELKAIHASFVRSSPLKGIIESYPQFLKTTK